MNEFFKDLKVVELASVLAGPAVGMFFSELGAEVVKIENKTTGGDMTRNWKLPTESEEGVSAYYCSVNYKKQVLFKNLKDQNDYDEVLKLISEADIVIGNYTPQKAKKLKVDYETIKSIKDDIIYANIVGYPNSEKPAFDLILQAETGFMSMNGEPDGNPVKMPVALIDVLCAHQLKEGVLMALLKREKTGKGSFVEASLYESALASLANQATNWLMEGHIPQKMGSLHPNIAPYGEMFITKDGVQITFAIGTDKQFQLLANFLEIENIENFVINELRVKNRTALGEVLKSKVEQLNWGVIERFCEQNMIPVAEIKSLETVFDTTIANQIILEEKVESKLTRRVKTVAFNIKE